MRASKRASERLFQQRAFDDSECAKTSVVLVLQGLVSEEA